ncbi:helix-turn-helix domain-containing protein [Pseudomonas sp. TCU-HL1]|uniref:helix-turn-helix domain-containing protein n=1 Tax=Pseudomonas sp. TCU-HL1 TaxID=1856685 RepID=UPI00083CC8E5|nr:helix-turn-helix domain-containing protein [Pseudomonas sp. TCU-HL1]AOE87524.1 XRE family transcriptional regulator [Pseudomonas sp. TCU-HL1]
MDHQLIIQRLGQQIREKRLSRGFTQAELGRIAGLTRQKIVAVEKGSSAVNMGAYARAIGALDCELAMVVAAMPTLDDVQGLFE